MALVAITYGRGAWGISPSAASSNCQRVRDLVELCHPSLVFRIGSTDVALCELTFRLPCNGSLISWTPIPLYGGVDPWSVGVSLYLLGATPEERYDLPPEVRMVVSTDLRAEPVSRRITSAKFIEQGVSRLYRAFIVGPTRDVSPSSNASGHGLTNSEGQPIAEICLPYDVSAVGREQIFGQSNLRGKQSCCLVYSK